MGVRQFLCRWRLQTYRKTEDRKIEEQKMEEKRHAHKKRETVSVTRKFFLGKKLPKFSENRPN
jgi:hypothetical protein